MTNEEKTEKYQNIVLAAIKKIENIKDEKSAARFALMNNSIYEVAMEAVKIAEEIEYSQPQVIELFGKRVIVVKEDNGLMSDCEKCDLKDCCETELPCKTADGMFNRHFVEVDENGNEL